MSEPRLTQLPKPPAPLKVPPRAQPPAPPKPDVYVPTSLAEKLREESRAGELKADFDLAMNGGGLTESLMQEFAGAGPWARDGHQPCGVTAVVAKNGPRRLMIEAERPGRSGRYPTRQEFEPSVGADGTLASPQALAWLVTQVTDLREAPDGRGVPLLILIEADVIGNEIALTSELRAALDELARDQRCCIGVIRRVNGYRADSGSALDWVPFEGGAS